MINGLGVGWKRAWKWASLKVANWYGKWSGCSLPVAVAGGEPPATGWVGIQRLAGVRRLSAVMFSDGAEVCCPALTSTGPAGRSGWARLVASTVRDPLCKTHAWQARCTPAVTRTVSVYKELSSAQIAPKLFGEDFCLEKGLCPAKCKSMVRKM